MTPRELDILIAQTMESIYRTSLDNNLTSAEYNYFIHSILYDIAINLNNSAYKKMKDKMEA